MVPENRKIAVDVGLPGMREGISFISIEFNLQWNPATCFPSIIKKALYERDNRCQAVGVMKVLSSRVWRLEGEDREVCFVSISFVY